MPPFVSPRFRLDFPNWETLPCPSFPCFFGKWQGKTPKKQGFFIPTEPLKSLEKKRKMLKKTRNSLQGKKQGIPKKTRKGRTGFGDSGSEGPGRLSGHVRPRHGREICNFGVRCRLHWIVLNYLPVDFCLSCRLTVQFSKEMAPECG